MWRLLQGYAYSSENVAGLGQSDYGILNVGLSFSSTDESWSLGIWGRNLADEDYRTWSSDISDFGTYSDYWGAPRSVGVELQIQL